MHIERLVDNRITDFTDNIQRKNNYASRQDRDGKDVCMNYNVRPVAGLCQEIINSSL